MGISGIARSRVRVRNAPETPSRARKGYQKFLSPVFPADLQD
jgi:hypothetical protein